MLSPTLYCRSYLRRQAGHEARDEATSDGGCECEVVLLSYQTWDHAAALGGTQALGYRFQRLLNSRLLALLRSVATCRCGGADGGTEGIVS